MKELDYEKNHYLYYWFKFFSIRNCIEYFYRTGSCCFIKFHLYNKSNISYIIRNSLYYLVFGIQCLLSKKITKEYLLEIPLSFVFGYLNDFYDYIIHITPSSFIHSLLLLCIALLCISLGVYLTSETNFVLNPGDGIVKTISEVFHYPFYNVKNMFDISMILCTLVLS